MSNLIDSRDMRERDIPFVISSWLNQYRVSPYAGIMGHEEYFMHYRAFVGHLLDSPGVRVAVAINPNEEDEGHEIWGYIVYERADLNKDPIVHWVYVKDGLRKNGVGTYLFQQAGIGRDDKFTYTFRTSKSDWILKSAHHRDVKINAAHKPFEARNKVKHAAEEEYWTQLITRRSPSATALGQREAKAAENQNGSGALQ